ncbi:hypothetical protein RI367_001771 [Sorochytrium milnesiophthora]
MAATAEAGDGYLIRPNFKHKFKPSVAQKIIHQVLVEKLSGQAYSADNATQWTRDISDDIRNRLKDEQNERYKFVVNVVLGEQRGEGARMGCRCFWDQDTDNLAQDMYMNRLTHLRPSLSVPQDSLFCVAVVFAVYYY